MRETPVDMARINDCRRRQSQPQRDMIAAIVILAQSDLKRGCLDARQYFEGDLFAHHCAVLDIPVCRSRTAILGYHDKRTKLTKKEFYVDYDCDQPNTFEMWIAEYEGRYHFYFPDKIGNKTKNVIKKLFKGDYQ